MSALGRRLAAEFIGTFWLVLGGCGSAVLAAAFPDVGIGLLGVALAFGLTVLTMAYAFGHVSGGHFNPAVTLGLWIGGRFNARDVLPYIVTQVVAGIAAAGVLLAIANGKPSYSLKTDGLAANGYGKHSPGGYGLGSALLTEILMTAAFLIVILAVTGRGAPVGFGPLAIGLALTLIHLISIPGPTRR
jgi:aquaporin Z